jgi:cytochrome P450
MTTLKPLVLGTRFLQDPHTIEAAARIDAPVRRVVLAGGLRAWLVTRYDDVKAVLTDPRICKASGTTTELLKRYFQPNAPVLWPAVRALDAHMLNTDPPDHARLRGLVGKAFTTRRVAALQPRIEQIADDLLDRMATERTVDLVDGYAYPLSMTVIFVLLGIPDADRTALRKWFQAVTSTVPDGRQADAAGEMSAYLGALIDRKREAPEDDLLSALTTASQDDQRLSQAELLAMATLLVVAAVETTAGLISSGVFELLRAPEQLAALRAAPELLANAVEELLRYESPVHIGTSRFTTEEVQLGEVVIPAGEFVMVSLLSANRDEKKFPDADMLDVTTPTSGHLAFGYGIHYCLGAPLARLEGRTAVWRLLDRFESLRLAVEPETLTWVPSALVRGLSTLPVHLS